MKINGTPVNHGLPTKRISGGGKGRSGCLGALITIAILGTGWLHMIATSAGWTS